MKNILLPGIVGAVLSAGPGVCATFDVVKDLSGQSLGRFEAPATGGLLTAAAVLFQGAVFAELGIGDRAPVYHAERREISGVAAQVGEIRNTEAFVAPGFGPDPVECGIGACAFTFEEGSGGVPGEWHVDKIATQEAVGVGRYRIIPAAVPLPAGFGLLLAGLLAGAGIVRRRR